MLRVLLRPVHGVQQRQGDARERRALLLPRLLLLSHRSVPPQEEGQGTLWHRGN